MGSRFKDAEHLLRLVALFAAGTAIFFVVRTLLIPEGFGELGHYRVGAIADNRDQPLVFAGRGICTDCHDDIVETKLEGGHAGVGCEACHGPLAAHAEDPMTAFPELPQPDEICLTCHLLSVAKPESFPQIDVDDHSGGEPCSGCHEPHLPL